jgi:hypothetical protein
MISNLEKYKKDIDNLIKKGEELLSILRTNENLILFRKEYEIWYSESLSLIKIVIPNILFQALSSKKLKLFV